MNMSRSWPPSPCVEDEDTSLAREHLFGSPLEKVKSQNQPAESRGTVDQTPIILDGTQHRSKASRVTSDGGNDAKFPPAFSSDSSSSDESSGPATPPSRRASLTRTRPLTTNKDNNENASRRSPPRGRPSVSRIETNAGGDLHSMATGQRRVPSPYSYSSGTQSAHPYTVKRFNAASFLSPTVEKVNRSSSYDGRRTVEIPSKHKESIGTTTINSEQHPRPPRPRSLSRHRASPRVRVNAEQDDLVETSPSKHRNIPAPITTESPKYRDLDRGHQTPPQSPRMVNESPNLSADEDRERHRSHRHERRTSRDSHHTSSADENTHKHRIHRHSHLNEVETQTDGSPIKDRHHQFSDRSSRTSVDLGRRGEFEYLDRRHAGDDRKVTDSPSSARLGFNLGMEDLLEKAFLENQKRKSNQRPSSNRPTPLASPTVSPPRTPRSIGPPRDYFDLPVHGQTQSGRHSRQGSVDESPRDRKSPRQSLVSAIHNRSKPILTRVSTTSVDTGSSGSRSQTASGQRSRRSSPVYEPQLPLSRKNSMVGKNDPRAPQSAVYLEPSSRPQSRDGKYQSALPDHIRPPQRALSYNTATESGQRRPSGPLRTASAIPSTTSGSGLYIGVPSPITTVRPQLTSKPAIVPSSPSSVKIDITTLPHCTRSSTMPASGEWYTVQGLTYLDFCSTCMKTLGNSRYRDVFVPSLPRRSVQMLKCSNSNPWIRLAWIESDREKRSDLKLIKGMAIPPPSQTKPCPGSKSDVRRWYHFSDLRTQKPIENFDVCSACVHNLEWLYPSLEGIIFERPEGKPHQERSCRLNIDSKHFPVVAEKLLKLAKYARQNDIRDGDLEAFADHLRQISRFRECARDEMLATPLWHIIPDLPEFTICEECYDEVVWPLANKPIAREVTKSARVVPFTRRADSVPGLSCQLYSKRMRAVFCDAVAKNDFDLLQKVTRRRYDIEQKLQERKRLYERDIIAGQDRRADIERLYATWREYE